MDLQQDKSAENSSLTPLPSSSVALNSANPASKSSMLRFPVRIGITWKKGERLEAQDFSNTWYPSKIVEISEEEKAVLIHFEGWNQRYDEWFHMVSDRLRPTTRHSERKDKGIYKRRRVNPHPIYRPGDEVLARWKDCKKYPAKISRLIEESTYEVVFYDGVTHLIQAMNIQPMPEEMKAVAKNLPLPPRNKFSFKQVKVSLPASIRKKEEQKKERTKQTLAGSILARSKRSPSKLIAKAKLLPKVTLKRDRELDVFSVTANKGPPSPPKKEKPITITCEATLSTLSEAECLQLFGPAAVGDGNASVPNSGELSHSSDSVSMVAVNTPGGVGTRESSSSMQGTTHETLLAKKRKGGKKHLSSRIRKRAYTDTSTGGVKKRKLTADSTEFGTSNNMKVSKMPQPLPLGYGERSKSLDIPGHSAGTPPPLAPLAPHIFIPSKAFIVEEDHNPFKCPYEGCTKDFRKDNLLQYHIKYYHTELEVNSSTSSPTAVLPQPAPNAPTQTSSGTPVVTSCGTLNPLIAGVTSKPKTENVSSAAVQTTSVSTLTQLTPSKCTPKRRRRKTDSICSTDSEMSASSKSKSSKRIRNDSEISVTTESPEVAGRETQTDSSRLVEELAAEDEAILWPDTEEAEEEEMASDMVNCVCGERHHSGLMIQCEVCMCWQHFKCADVKKTGVPPLNYVCLICENAPGTRDSCKYLHDMGWERRGELPTFPFSQQKPARSNPSSRSSPSHLASECNYLLSTLHGVKCALHSTRRQIKISKEEGDPEFQLWQTDWDNWVKPQEVLTLTPRSGDPELSPTSSTFLFPPALANVKDTNKTTEDSKSNKGSSLGFIDAFIKFTKEESKSSMHAPPKSESPQILPSSSAASATSSSSSGSTKAPVHTFSSQLFSLSSTPPKISALPASENSNLQLVSPSKLGEDFSRDVTHQVQPDESLPSVSKSTKNLLLAVNTTQALSINTSSAPSPSSSSLSSLQMSTPPMMLSPVTGAEGVPPQTPSVGRTSSHLSTFTNQAEVSGLIKDLFPGPGGDAPAQHADKPPELSQTKIKGCLSFSDVDHPQTSKETSTSSVPSKQNVDESIENLAPDPQKQYSAKQREDQSLFLTSSSDNVEDRKTDSSHQDQDKASTILVQKREPSPDGNHIVQQRDVPFSPTSPCTQDYSRNNFWDRNAKQHNGNLSPDHVTSLYLNANGNVKHGPVFSVEDDEDTQDNDTDTAEESADPYKNCEQNLLVHVQKVHSDIEQQLHGLEARILELENSENNNPFIELSEDNILNDIPALKKSLSKLARHLMKVQHFTS